MVSQDLPGQASMVEVFDALVRAGRMPHALLIHGSEGGVSLPLALWLSQRLMCESPDGTDPCGTCPECVRTTGYTHPDVHFVFPVNTNKQVKNTKDRHSSSFLTDWRAAISDNPYLNLLDWYGILDIENKQGFIGEEESAELRKKLALRSFEGGWRVFILWHADRMNATFANKILKNLEEPSERTLFILLSENPSRLLPTIISRVQVFREEHISESELAAYLVRAFGMTEQKAMDVSFRAEGNVNQAIREANNGDDPWLEDFKMLMRYAYSRDLIQLFNWSEKMAKRSRDSQRQFCEAALKVMDRCYRMGWVEVHIPMEGEEAKFYKDFSPFINAANIAGFVDLLQQCALHIERNVYEKLVWYDTCIDAVRLIHAGRKSAAARS